MGKGLQSIISKRIESVVLTINNHAGTFVLKEKAEDAYRNLQMQVEYLPTQYTDSNLNYQKQYWKEKVDYYQDISLVIKMGGECIGIWPLCVVFDGKNFKLGSAGGSIVKPIVVREGFYKQKTMRRLWRECISLLRDLMGELDINVCSVVQNIYGPVDLWNRVLMEQGGIVKGAKYSAYRDIEMEDHEVKKHVHRTVNQSVRDAECEYLARIITKDSDDVRQCFEEFRKLHIYVSGRETRSRITWDAQLKNIIEGKDILVILAEKTTGEIVGGTLVVIANRVATYAVGAYDRRKFDSSLGHGAQKEVIEYLRRIGVKWYELGERPYSNRLNEDEKVVKIGLFKEKFATHIFCQLEILLEKI